jgi:signal transduction histidine kinase
VTFRRRILNSSIILVWIPLIVLALATKLEMNRRLTNEYHRRVGTLASVAAGDLESLRQSLRDRLGAFRATIENDNRFRLAMEKGEDKSFVLDYAGHAMGLLGVSMLQIQDAGGRIVSSGHFRNEYDRKDPALIAELGTVSNRLALLPARKPEGSVLVLAVMDSLQLAGAKFYLVGGVELEDRFLSHLTRAADQAVTLLYPGGVLSSSEGLRTILLQARERGKGWDDAFPRWQYVARKIEIPFLGGEAPPQTATLVVSHSLEPLNRLLRNLDLWLGAVLVATISGTLLLSLWTSSRISRPLAELAAKTSQMRLDRYEEFAADRDDEVGELSRFLNEMMRRVRAGVQELREAERRATLGEMARQINHDVRNGLTPIRNILRHLGEVAAETPEDLTRVWREREPALRSSLTYLEGLASNYARLYWSPPRHPCDLNTVVREVVLARREGSPAKLEMQLADRLPPLLADQVGLHRIVENLVANAQDSSDGDEGRVELRTYTDPSSERIYLSVSDNGAGIAEADLSKVFGDFYTTKKRGMGLGLSIVRRLVADYDGSVRVSSQVGRGTRFEVEFPAAEPSPENGSDRAAVAEKALS